MIVIDEKFLVIKEINGYLVDMILINSFRSGGEIVASISFASDIGDIKYQFKYLEQFVLIKSDVSVSLSNIVQIFLQLIEDLNKANPCRHTHWWYLHLHNLPSTIGLILAQTIYTLKEIG
jgi:hypothetical protein